MYLTAIVTSFRIYIALVDKNIKISDKNHQNIHLYTISLSADLFITFLACAGPDFPLAVIRASKSCLTISPKKQKCRGLPW
jgi:hypothetical protein